MAPPRDQAVTLSMACRRSLRLTMTQSTCSAGIIQQDAVVVRHGISRLEGVRQCDYSIGVTVTKVDPSGNDFRFKLRISLLPKTGDAIYRQ